MKNLHCGSRIIFALAEKAIGWGVRLGHNTEKMIGATGVNSISKVAEKIFHDLFAKVE